MSGDIALFLLAIIAVLFLIAELIQWLWNRTMLQVFSLPPLEYWQAFRLYLLINLLFGRAVWFSSR